MQPDDVSVTLTETAPWRLFSSYLSGNYKAFFIKNLAQTEDHDTLSAKNVKPKLHQAPPDSYFFELGRRFYYNLSQSIPHRSNRDEK